MITITITGDKFANVVGDMEDFLNGGHLDVQGADFEVQEETPPTPVKARRGRKPKAAAPVAGATQDAKAATLPASPATPTQPAAAAPSTNVGEMPKGSALREGGAPAAAAPALDASAVAPGGAVFAAVKAYNDKHGMEKARALLLSFGCGTVRQIKPEQYAAVIAKCAE